MALAVDSQFPPPEEEAQLPKGKFSKEPTFKPAEKPPWMK